MLNDSGALTTNLEHYPHSVSGLTQKEILYDDQ